MISQIKKWLHGSKRQLNSEYLIVDSSESLEQYAEK